MKKKKAKVKEFTDNSQHLKELEEEFIQSLIDLRKDKGLTQQELAEACHVIRESIARVETLKVSPQVRTLLRVLEPLGYTVCITPIKKKKDK